MRKLFIIGFALAASAFGQLTTTLTTLSSAVTSTNTDQWCLASASGVVVPTSTTNGSYLLADREAVQVMSQGLTSTCFKVKRGQLGTSASVGHSAASTVWIGQPATSSGDPSRPFSGAFVNTVPTGSCVASAQYTLPVIYTGSAAQGAIAGSAWGCVQSQWVQVGNSQLTGLTGTSAIYDIYAFASGAVFRGNNAAGTPASPTATQNGTGLASFGGRGYGATGYSSSSRGSMVITATENWTDASQGTRFMFFTTPNGSTTPSSVWTIENDGNFTPITAGAVGIGTTALPVKSLFLANCTSAAAPAVCGASTVGAVVVAAAATTVVVNTTAVTAKSRIVLTMDSSLGTDLSVTCNTTNIAANVSARTAATSFTITLASGPVTNPQCMSYHILN